MSSAEPAVSTAGGNESDTSEQGRSEASSSSQDTSATNDTSPTNDTSLEEEDAPVGDDKYKYITWSNKTGQKCFSGEYKEERPKLAKLIERLWPYAFDYRPEVILKKATDRSNKLVYHLDVADSDSHDTLFPDGVLPWKPGRGKAIENLKKQLVFMAGGEVRAPVDRSNLEAVDFELYILDERFKRFALGQTPYCQAPPSAKNPKWGLMKEGIRGKILLADFDTELELAVCMEKRMRKDLIALEEKDMRVEKKNMREEKRDVRVERNTENRQLQYVRKKARRP